MLQKQHSLPFLMAQGQNLMQRSLAAPRVTQIAKASNQNVVVGNSGYVGGGEDPTTYVFNQPTPAASWLITHNLNGFPSVTTTDLTGNVILGQVQYLDANTVLVVFSQPVAGAAYLNM